MVELYEFRLLPGVIGSRLFFKMKIVLLTRGLHTTVSDRDYFWIRKHKWYAQKAGKHFYAARRAGHNGPIILLHREVLGAGHSMRVDHRDLDTLHNFRRNLRLATCSQNLGNQPKQTGPRHSQFKGVCWSKASKTNPWVAYITAQRKTKHLGYFSEEILAAKAYNKAAKKWFGRFARLNTI